MTLILKYRVLRRFRNRKSLLTSLYQREEFPLFGKEEPGEIPNLNLVRDYLRLFEKEDLLDEWLKEID